MNMEIHIGIFLPFVNLIYVKFLILYIYNVCIALLLLKKLS